MEVVVYVVAQGIQNEIYSLTSSWFCSWYKVTIA